MLLSICDLHCYAYVGFARKEIVLREIEYLDGNGEFSSSNREPAAFLLAARTLSCQR